MAHDRPGEPRLDEYVTQLLLGPLVGKFCTEATQQDVVHGWKRLSDVAGERFFRFQR